MLFFSRWTIAAILAVILAGLIALLPTVLSTATVSAWPSFLAKRQIVLGLDLQGGAYLLYGVDRPNYVQSRLRTLVGAVNEALQREPAIAFTGLGVQGDAVQVRISDTARIADARARLAALSGPVTPPSGGAAIDEFAVMIGSDGVARIAFSDAGLAARLGVIIDQSIAVIGRRVAELGLSEPVVERKGRDQILVEAPGLRDTAQLKDIIDQPGELAFHLVDAAASIDDALQGRTPPGTLVLVSYDDPPETFVVVAAPLLTSADLVDVAATVDLEADTGAVGFRLSPEGIGKLAAITGSGGPSEVAIALDDQVIAVSPLADVFSGDSGRIDGDFSASGAGDLAVLLRSGALPAQLSNLEERTVGPGLGADSIRAGVVAAIVGALAVAIFMIAAYGLLGLAADIAVLVNVMLILAAMALLQATLTLPGIAGIVLTIGMAVDANVLIYERIREEARAGRSTIASIDAGFSRALPTILDANITTLIAAVVLFFLGSGPVRGFAVTVAIGVVTTIFTAVLVTRLLVAAWVRYARPTSVPI